MSAKNCIPLFPNEEIPRLLTLVLHHAGTLQKLNETEHEDDLSDRLFKRLRIDHRVRKCPFSIHREFRVYDAVIDQAGHKGRIDICFICSGGDQTYFAIEAKRLHVTTEKGGWTSLVSEYVTGDQGMMCFVTSKYSAVQRAGAMLGYVFDGDVCRARTGISKAIDANRGVLKTSGSDGLVESNIIKRQERIDETRHRFGRRPFTIYHLLVPV